MLPEISLNILDIAQNSIRADATLAEIRLVFDSNGHTLLFWIRDNGCGMTPEQLARVSDPFYTSRSTRKVGLGIPFLKQAAEATGGSFKVESRPGAGTCVQALFHTDHIDCMPLGDLNNTMLTLLTGLDEGLAAPDSGAAGKKHPVDLVYTYRVDDREFVLDTRELRQILGDVSFGEPEVYAFLSEYLQENTSEVDGGKI